MQQVGSILMAPDVTMVDDVQRTKADIFIKCSYCKGRDVLIFYEC